MANWVNRFGTEEERFWRKVQVNYTTGCWEWQAGGNTGYGLFSLRVSGYKRRPKQVYAHVWSFNYLVGPIPDGLEIDHLCRNRACVNPKHMEPVTSYVNTMRGFGISAIMSMKLYCNRGHRMFGDGLKWVGKSESGTRQRICMACRLEKRQGIIK